MADDRIHSSEEIPEADHLEQQVPLDPQPPDAESVPDTPVTFEGTVDEADLMEQQTAVPDGDEDDYPHEPGDERWA